MRRPLGMSRVGAACTNFRLVAPLPGLVYPAAAAQLRFQSQSTRGSTTPFVEGELLDKFSSTSAMKRLDPTKMAHYVKSRIQNDRMAQGLPEIDDWVAFAEGAVFIPTNSGPLWVGADDPRCERFMRRKEKMKRKPQQVARSEPGVDRTTALESHPLRNYFTTSTNLADPLSIADGLYKTGRIKSYDVKHMAAHLKWMPRPPIVSIMGHVDHGKTTLLDFLRKTNVAAGEAGGITQSVGAFTVHSGTDRITFIDTPGHEAFSEMRKSGAAATDLIVLVVSTVDGVQPQTQEVVELAAATLTPLVVAANKIDRSEDLEPIKMSLRELGVVFEEDGGETQIVPISALKGMNIPDLLDAIVLQAAMLELATPEPCRAEVSVIDSAAPDKNLVAAIVRCGTLRPGMVLAAGMTYALVQKVYDEHGEKELKQAPVGTPVLLAGFKVLPKPGAVMFQLAGQDHGEKFNLLMRDVYTAEGSRESYLQTLAAETRGAIYNRKPDNNFTRQYASKPFTVVVKAGTFGQLQALLALLYDLPALDGVHLYIRSAEVGGITDIDIVGLNSMQNKGAVLVFGATKDSYRLSLPSYLDAHYFDVVYHGVQWLKEQMVAMLPDIVEDIVISVATCQQVFRASQAGAGNAAGLIVDKGTLVADAEIIRVLRPPRRGETPVSVFEGRLKELRRFKDIVPSVDEGMECGVILEDDFLFRQGDVVQEIRKKVIPRNVEEEFASAAEEERRRRAIAVAQEPSGDAEDEGPQLAADSRIA